MSGTCGGYSMKKFYHFLFLLAMILIIIVFTACSMDPASEPEVPTESPEVPTEPSEVPKEPPEVPIEPSFEVKTEIPIFDGSTLEFSEKPVRAQWGIGDSEHLVAFVFPKNTRIRQRLNGTLVPIYAVSEYQVVNRILPWKEWKTANELTLTDEMGKEAYGIRIISTNIERGSLLIYIDGITERAVNPGDSIIYASDFDQPIHIPTDDATLANLRLPSERIQSDDPEIVALAETITKDINNDLQKAKAIHLWVAGNIFYDRDLYNYKVFDIDAIKYRYERGYSTYVLQNKRGVCDGYASLTVALLRAAGIPAKYIPGYGYNNRSSIEGHAWTEAYVDNKWINMDTTWDSKNKYENGNFSDKQAPGSSWFNVPDKEFSRTHMYLWSIYAIYILKNGLAATKKP